MTLLHHQFDHRAIVLVVVRNRNTHTTEGATMCLLVASNLVLGHPGHWVSHMTTVAPDAFHCHW